MSLALSYAHEEYLRYGLINVKKPWGEDIGDRLNNEDCVRPYFLALIHHQFGLCEMLALPDEELKMLTQKELTIIRDYLKSKENITSLNRLDK